TAGSARRPGAYLQDISDTSSGDNEIKRNEQIRGRARCRDRYAKRKNRDRDDRKRLRPASKEDREQPDHETSGQTERDELLRVVADRAELLGVDDVADEDHP